MTAVREAREAPFWSYEDFVLFIGAVLPCAALVLVVVRRFHFPGKGVEAITSQFLLYLLLLGVLYFLIGRRYRQPMWRSLGWNFQFRGALLCAVAGPVLAIALAWLGAKLRAPQDNRIQDLVTDRLSLILFILFGALIAPIFEELVFRGFLLPLLARSLGSWSGIILTAIPFALLHIVTYGWIWQTILVVGIAGVVFGWVRVKTGSTAAAAMIHMGYNAMLFAAFLLQRWFQVK